MGPKRVTTPDGMAWTVRRCWLPKRRLRWRRPTPHRQSNGGHDGSGLFDSFDVVSLVDNIEVDNPLAIIGVVLAIVAVLALAWFFLVPFLLALLDAVILIALAGAAIVGHVVLHRPWEIEASGPEQTQTWRVLGWRRSGQAIDAASRRLSGGRPLPADVRDLLPR
jgi:hypothetical protein